MWSQCDLVVFGCHVLASLAKLIFVWLPRVVGSATPSLQWWPYLHRSWLRNLTVAALYARRRTTIVNSLQRRTTMQPPPICFQFLWSTIDSPMIHLSVLLQEVMAVLPKHGPHDFFGALPCRVSPWQLEFEIARGRRTPGLEGDGRRLGCCRQPWGESSGSKR